MCIYLEKNVCEEGTKGRVVNDERVEVWWGAQSRLGKRFENGYRPTGVLYIFVILSVTITMIPS